MEHNEIRAAILAELYEAYFSSERSGNLPEIKEMGGWSDPEFSNVQRYLQNDHLVKGHTMGGNYIITFYGIEEVEQYRFGLSDLIRENDQMRISILARLFDIYEAKGMPNCTVGLDTLQKELQSDKYQLVGNLRFLEHLDLIENVFSAHWRITNRGIDAASNLRRHDSLIREFSRIRGLNPQARGREFQKLFAKIVGENEWNAQYVVSGDSDLKDLDQYESVQMVSPWAFLQILKSQAS